MAGKYNPNLYYLYIFYFRLCRKEFSFALCFAVVALHTRRYPELPLTLELLLASLYC